MYVFVCVSVCAHVCVCVGYGELTVWNKDVVEWIPRLCHPGFRVPSYRNRKLPEPIDGYRILGELWVEGSGRLGSRGGVVVVSD